MSVDTLPLNGAASVLQEWGGACPHPYRGAYRLENDHSWTPEEDLGSRATDDALIEQILHNKRVLAISQPTEAGAPQ